MAKHKSTFISLILCYNYTMNMTEQAAQAPLCSTLWVLGLG